MYIRSRAPLRIGLAGGGTDVSPYSDIYGGAILNSTVSMYAYGFIEPWDNEKIVFHAADRNETLEFDLTEELPIDGNLDLVKGVYNRIVREFTKKPLSFRLTTFVDAPPGSGLGSSSTLAVAALGAFTEWLQLPLGEYDIAKIAFEVERIELGMAGGKQDQYAATFGGFNFMEFHEENEVIVNPLRLRDDTVRELEHNLLLYYTDTSRVSSEIIEDQRASVEKKEEKPVEAMHKLKEQAVMMKEALLSGEVNAIGKILNFGWEHKKQLASSISNPMIDEIYDIAMNAGATGGKISGAGGGGFMTLYCPLNTRYKVFEALEAYNGSFRQFQFTKNGLTTWRAY
jgi:D-glycero-alpha-D-manno-heptose-7-phosphate kinase